jgi:class I lanthipeptide synthase
MTSQSQLINEYRALPGVSSLPEWQALLVGAERERALRGAVALADRLRWLESDRLGCSLASGSAGLAVLFSSLARTLGTDRYLPAAERYMQLAADGACADARAVGVGLHGGVSGVGWAEAHVADMLSEPGPTGDDLDELLATLLEADPWRGSWELTSGLAGLGVYALQRAPEAPRLLGLVVDRLLDTRARDGAWMTDAQLLFGADGGGRPPRYLDLGMAHGLAGVVAFAALALRAGCDAARDLLADATGSLLAHLVEAGESPVFPALIADGGPVATPGPRWCYGDLGVAAALALAAPLMPHPSLSSALRRALRAVSESDPGDAQVADLGLCHGMAGVAHVLHVLAMTTGATEATAAARRWTLRLLDQVEDQAPMSGPGLLDGAAGVALVLLAASTDEPPRWNRALLIA